MKTTQDILLVAHRGESMDAPENTMEAFELAWRRGDEAIELDIHLTRDGQVVVCHDADTLRTCGEKLMIKEHTLEEIQRLRPRCPGLGEVYAGMGAGKKCFTEIKSGVEVVEEFARVYGESGKSAEEIVVICFRPDALVESKRRLAGLKHYLLGAFEREKGTGRWKKYPGVEDYIAKAKEIGVEGLDLQAAGPLDEGACRRIKEAGLELGVWTVDEVEVARRYVGWGVDSITTNRACGLRGELGSGR